MTIKTQLQKKISFGQHRRASQDHEPQDSNANNDTSESYHHSKAYRALFTENSKRLSSIYGGDGSLSTSEVSAFSIDIECTTQKLAVQVAEEVKAGFRNTLPQSLIDAEDEEGRDCIAPFQRREVSGVYNSVFGIYNIIEMSLTNILPCSVI